MDLIWYLSLPYSLVVTCWEMADLLNLLHVMFSYVFVTFPYSVLGQMWYLIVSNSDLCLLSYFISRRVLYKYYLACFRCCAVPLYSNDMPLCDILILDLNYVLLYDVSMLA